MKRGADLQPDLDLAANSHPGNAPPLGNLTQDLREKLLCELARILDELDARGLPLVAVHVDAAISALKNARAPAS